MTKLFGNLISVEMLALWTLESVLSAFVIYSFITWPSDLSVAQQILPHQSAEKAAVFALTIGVTALMLGLYRPETCVEIRRLIITTAASGVIAFPILLLVGQMLRIDPDVLVGPDPLWPCKILFSWLACLIATRLAFSLTMRYRLGMRPATAGVAHPRTGSVDAGPGGGNASQGMRGRIDVETLNHDWLQTARAMRSSGIEDAVRRFGDIFIASMFLIGTAPLMAITALLIRLDSPGGILYRQERVGLDGRSFTLLKFRSMRSDAEKGSGPSWAAKSDPRITRIGSFIRRTRIDELPQILNVLRGEMSFIGPRPERPHFVSQLAEVIPHYHDRAHVKPGLTGWAQVNFPYGASIDDARMKLSYDLYYIRHRSLLLDMLILVSTIRVILFQEGAR